MVGMSRVRAQCHKRPAVWRAVGWMEMGLSQADVARRLNASHSVVQRLWDWFGQGSRSVATLTCMCSMEEP
ncbi:hypothetical protein TNCV_3136891 [Trichonephila clavipes]|nr:hypothetical protein TNCV_3136891 [Trichonephila clavipes]